MKKILTGFLIFFGTQLAHAAVECELHVKSLNRISNVQPEETDEDEISLDGKHLGVLSKVGKISICSSDRPEELNCSKKIKIGREIVPGLDRSIEYLIEVKKEGEKIEVSLNHYDRLMPYISSTSFPIQALAQGLSPEHTIAIPRDLELKISCH